MLLEDGAAARGSARTMPLGLSARDIAAVGALLALWAVLFVVRYDAMPLQLWDESRNANNALEMALHGRWLTPTYAGAVDHWNTKPPLLIWMQAALLRLGLAPLLALRLPSMLAALATAAMLWAALRSGLKDRLAGLAATTLLFSAVLYDGPHAGRTGDYDALESAFMLAYVLAAWAALETGRARWVLAAAAGLALAMLTKGVAAALPLPGLCLYALTQPRRLAPLLKAPLTWVSAASAILLVAGYYLLREAADPGYLAAVAGNEIAGRFLKVAERHHGDGLFYVGLLSTWAEPCATAALAAGLTVAGADSPRRRLALATLASVVSLLAVLSAARSKLEWYAVPAIPMLALLGGLGLSDLIRAGAAWRPSARRPLQVVVALLLAGGALFAVACSQGGRSLSFGEPGGAKLRYGGFLEAVRARIGRGGVNVVDGGFANDAGFADYDPVLKFYADRLSAQGWPVATVRPGAALPRSRPVASCDPITEQALQESHRMAILMSDGGCILARPID